MERTVPFIELDNKRVDERILTTRFSCDLGACHGACCTFPGGAGAPIDPSEMPILRKAWELLGSEVPEMHRAVVNTFGLFEHIDGKPHLRCFNERACVFVAYEGDIAKCVIQRAWNENRFNWVKPASCHLFPIRVGGTTGDTLRFEEFSECRYAIERGETSDTRLVDFLQEPLVRVFGEEFAQALHFEARQRESDHERHEG